MQNQSSKSISQFSLTQSGARNQIILGTVLILIFGSLGGAVLNRQNQYFTGFVLIRDLPSGTRVTQADLRQIQLSGALLENAIAKLPPRSITSRALMAGELLEASDLQGANAGDSVVSFEFSATALPVQLRVGDTVQIWQVIPAERASQIGQAEVLEIADTRYDAAKKVSLRIAPGLLPVVFMAQEDLQIVRIS